jgi:hypothetical protein
MNTLVSIRVSPSTLVLPPGASDQLIATALYSNGSASDVTSGRATWSVDGSNLASVLNGRVIAYAPGVVHVTATVGAVSGQATLTIPNLALTGVAISPDPVVVLSGGAARLTATGKYDDGTTNDVTLGAIWTIDDRSVATVSTSFAVGAAIVNGISPGMTAVHVSVGRTMPVMGTAPVTITQP